MVVARKVWGGNRTARGAQIQSILVSCLQTCRQQLQPAPSLLQTLLCSSQDSALFLSAQNPGLSRSYALNNYDYPCQTMVTAAARYGFGWMLLGQLLFADGARFSHHVRHGLYS
jgi:hypothetical protein